MQEYLETSQYIDYDHPEVKALALSLSAGLSTEEEIAKTCFEWVRDHIKHTALYKLSPITCKASDVLAHKTGYCFAKSHLLAALLRANGLPAGLCYQRLSIDDVGAPYSLHGFNAVFLRNYGWYRLDPRGNKEGVNAQFSPPHEQLAYTTKLEHEVDFPEIRSEPLAIVISVLETYQTYQDVYENLPDIEII